MGTQETKALQQLLENGIIGQSKSESLSFHWATVVQENPLRIQVDGDETWLPYAPPTINSMALVEGMRIALILSGKKYIILGGVDIDRLQPARTIKTTMANLQSTLNGLSKYLAGNVTISVSPSTTTGTITIERFYGPGSLTVQAVDASGAVVTTVTGTHKAANWIVRQNNTSGSLTLRGFDGTASDGNAFYILQNSVYVWVYLCNATGGAAATTTNIGFYSNENAGIVYFSGCNVSNKYYAFVAGMGGASIAAPTGSGNTYVYRGINGGSLRVRSAGTITGTNLYSHTAGGDISGVGATGIVGYSAGSPSSWRYIKYANGTAECWRTVTYSSTISTAWGNGFMTASQASQSYPFAFTSIPMLQISTSNNANAMCTAMIESGTSATATGSWRLFRTAALTTSATIYVHFHAIGHWL